MKVLVSGSSGLIGSHLVPYLRKAGHEVKVLVRPPKTKTAEQIVWDIDKQTYDPADFEGFDAVINLAGENISAKRWCQEIKQKILTSRSVGTEFLCRILSHLDSPPKVLINASAVGYYGNTGDAVVTEEDSSGSGFLAFVCREWENAALQAASQGIRVAVLRFGVVLTPDGGMLKMILPPFKFGLGGVIGSGEQYMSWISMDDLLPIVLLVMNDSQFSGPVNVVSPHPVTNREFTKTLGKVLQRPTIFPMPAFAAQLLFGEMAQEMLLSGQKVIPEKLERSGYKFRHSDLKSCLEHFLCSK